jgi:hypothetical protein
MLSGPAASDPLTYRDHRDLHHPRAPNFTIGREGVPMCGCPVEWNYAVVGGE